MFDNNRELWSLLLCIGPIIVIVCIIMCLARCKICSTAVLRHCQEETNVHARSNTRGGEVDIPEPSNVSNLHRAAAMTFSASSD